jgi:hypothetical protein
VCERGPESEKERERAKTQGNGVVRERVALRSGGDNGGRDGVAGGLSREAGLRAGAPWSHQVLPDHPGPAPTPLRGYLAPILRRHPPPRLVHQALPRVPRSDPNPISFFFDIQEIRACEGFSCNLSALGFRGYC